MNFFIEFIKIPYEFIFYIGRFLTIFAFVFFFRILENDSFGYRCKSSYNSIKTAQNLKHFEPFVDIFFYIFLKYFINYIFKIDFVYKV